MVNAIATLFLVVLPLTRIVGVIAASGDSAPRILAGFGDWRGAEGYPRPSRHRGVDIAGRPGKDVLAAAGGRVSVARDNRDLCGLIVVVDHDVHPYRTVYCDLSAISVHPARASHAASVSAPSAPPGSARGPAMSTCTWSSSEGAT